MYEKICCFCGHRNIIQSDIKTMAEGKLRDLIQNQNFNTFYSGGMGEFDIMCENIVRRLKDDFLHIKLCRIIYRYSSNLKEIQELFDEIIIADLGNVYYKQLIVERNKWMVNKSDALICCVHKNEGGAYLMMKYAKDKNKQIILL